MNIKKDHLAEAVALLGNGISWIGDAQGRRDRAQILYALQFAEEDVSKALREIRDARAALIDREAVPV